MSPDAEPLSGGVGVDRHHRRFHLCQDLLHVLGLGECAAVGEELLDDGLLAVGAHLGPDQLPMRAATAAVRTTTQTQVLRWRVWRTTGTGAPNP